MARFRFCVLLFSLVGLVLIASPPAQAGGCKGCGGQNGVEKAFKGTIEILYPHYEEMRDSLKGKPQDQWTREELTDYLQTALILVYHSCNLQMIQDGQHPFNLQDAANRGYMTEWPLNPVTWEPIQIWDVMEGFHAGDVSSQICPMSYSSGGRPLSYQLCIFGPTIDWAQSKPHVDIEYNSDWVIVPDGAVMTIGSVTMPDQ